MNKTLTGITVAPLTRLFTLGLCIFAIGHVWASAPTATAVWRSNLGDSYKIGGVTYGITPSSGTLNEDGTITAPGTWTTAAPYIELEGKGIDTISILVKYSGLNLATIYEADEGALGVAFASILDSDNNVIGSHVAKDDAAKSLRVYHCGASANEATQGSIGNTTVVEGSGYLLFSYSHSSGTRAYMGTSIAGLTGGGDTGFHWSNKTLKKLVIGGDISGKAWDCANFKIEEVALFVGSYLSNTDVSDYVFPTVTALNSESELTMTQLNGAIAANNAIYCASDNPVVTYDTTDSAPSTATKTFLQGANWCGTVWMKDLEMRPFQLADYGNARSTLKLSGVAGYFPNVNGTYSCGATIELVNSSTSNKQYGLRVDNGYSRDASNNRIIQFAKFKGEGELWCDTAAGTVTMQVLDWSEFNGKFQLVNKVLVLGDSVPEYSELNTGGTIYVCSGETASITKTQGWRANNKIIVNGTLKIRNAADFFSNSQGVLINEGGVLEIVGNGSGDTDKSYVNVTGTGYIKYSSNSTGYSTLPISAANMFATSLHVVNENTVGGVVITYRNTAENPAITTNRTISGSGKYCSDWGGSNGEQTRKLLAWQDANSEWKGVFAAGDRMAGMIVAGVAGSANKTLTLSGSQTHSNTLEIEPSGSANLTGTWIGDTTVDGEFGGTGTLTGNLTFGNGSVLKVFSTDDDGLTVSSNVTFPTGDDAMTVDLSGITISAGGIKILSSASLTSQSQIANITSSDALLRIEEGALVAYPKVLFVPTVGDAVAYSSVSDTITPIAMAGGSYQYVEVLTSEEQNISLSLLSEIKIKNTGGATLSFSGYGDDCQYYADTTTSDVYVIHKKVSKPTVYTWTGLAPQIYNYYTYEYEDDTRWSSKGNWTFVNSSSETVTATRAPSSGDYVYFTSNATVELGDSVTVASLISSAAVAISKDVSDVTLSATGGIILSAAGASITVDGVTLSPAPSTTVDGYYVKRTGTTTYTYTAVQKVASAVINDETVYFDDIDDAFAEITADHSVTVTIINGEGDYDDYDDTIAELGFFREGANVKFLAAELLDASMNVGPQYTTVQAAIDANDGTYMIVKVYQSASVTSSKHQLYVIKANDDVEFEIEYIYAGYEYGTPQEIQGFDGVYMYSPTACATTFTWNTEVSDGAWDIAGNWTSTKPVNAYPNNPLYNIVLDTEATITMRNVTVGSVSVGAPITLSSPKQDQAVTFTSNNGFALTSATASLTLTFQGSSGNGHVDLSCEPHTDLSGKYVDKDTSDSSRTVYTVATKVASVTDSGSNVTYYDSLATAVSSASTGDSIALFANSSEAITLNDKTINFSEGSYTFTGTFTGNGTVVLGAALKSASSDRWPVGWTGTVELKDITSVIADFNFAHYGNANSTVKANNVLICLNPEATGTDVGGVGAIEVASGGLKFGGTKIVDKIFYISATITGSGTISVGTPGGETDDAAHKATCTKYVFSGDYSAFRGAVNFSGASSYRAGIVFRNGSDTIPTQTDWGQIIVTENATLTTSGTLDGAGGFVIEGEIDLLSGGSVTTGGAKIGGDGLIVLTEGSSGALASSKFNSDKWTGVVELKNITTAIDSFDFVNYGTANSTVRANGVTVKENVGAIGNVGCIDVAAGGLTFGNSSVWKNDKTMTIAADITGSGSIVVATCENPAVAHSYYVFTGDITGFSGSLKAQAYVASYNSIIVIKDVDDVMPSATGVGQMFITENANVNVGASATWTATSFTIEGTMNVASGGALSGTVKGGGTVSFGAVPTSALTFSSWSGTVVLPSFAASGQNFNNFGVEGSKVQLTGITSGWLGMGTEGSAYTINPEVVLAGNMTLTDSSNRSWIFKKVSGTGNLSLTPGASNHKIAIRINDLASTVGTISNNMGVDTTWTIDKISFPAATALPAGTKLLSTGGNGTIMLGSITVGGVALSNVSYSRNTSGAEGDGFYVNAAATTTGTGESAVTTVTTDGSTTSVAVTLDNDYSGKIAVPANVATLTVTGPTITAGQLQLVTTPRTYDNLLSYSDGVVSLNPNAYYQNGEGEANKIYVEPKTAASDPMTMQAGNAPAFKIKTIPGLYYAVKSGTSPNSLTSCSTPAEAENTETTLDDGTALGNAETVRYYKISVGRTAAEAAEAAQ